MRSRYPGTVACRLSIQLRAASIIENTKGRTPKKLGAVSSRVQVGAMPPTLEVGIQVRGELSVMSGRRSSKSRPKVGQRGMGLSNKWKGKLLVMPPSANHTRSG